VDAGRVVDEAIVDSAQELVAWGLELSDLVGVHGGYAPKVLRSIALPPIRRNATGI
jgi:hypothetical protein